MRAFSVLITLAIALGVTGSAQAASIAYIDNGEVWVSSLDGTQKVRLAAPTVRGDGLTEKWLDVAMSDSGRIVAVRNVPGYISSSSWFKVWEPDGTSAVEGALNAPTGWTSYIYPLGFDLTADGKHMVYGYYNSSYGFPVSPYEQGTYVRLVTNGSPAPIKLSDKEDPTIVGSRVVAHSGDDIFVQDTTATTYGTAFTYWFSNGIALDLGRTEIAANGLLAAIELEDRNNGIGRIAVISIQGIDQFPAAGAVDCYVPASGIAKEASLALDAGHISWTDGQGLKVGGAPTGTADFCGLTTPPVVISPTGNHGAIGGANIAAFLPPVAPPPPPVTGPPTAGAAAPVANVPAKVKFPAAGLGVKVAVSGPGKVTITATVPAKAMGKKGKPVVIGTGNATAKAAGTVTVKLRLNKAAKKRLKKLKGTKMTLKIVQNGRTTTKVVTLR